MAKREQFTVETALAAVQAALVLAEVPCNNYPTPEGWDREMLENQRVLRRAHQALSFLRGNPCPYCTCVNTTTCNRCGRSY